MKAFSTLHACLEASLSHSSHVPAALRGAYNADQGKLQAEANKKKKKKKKPPPPPAEDMQVEPPVLVEQDQPPGQMAGDGVA